MPQTNVTETTAAPAVQTEPVQTPAEYDFPQMLTVSVSPHVHHADTTRSVMLDVLIVLLPALAWAVYQFGVRALWLTVATTASCVLFEFLWQKLLHKPVTVSDLSAAVTGVILAFNLPVGLPIWMAVIGAFFAIIVVKQLYGGIGKNVVNPALAARVFLMLAWTDRMTDFSVSGGALLRRVDGVASATPMAQMKSGNIADLHLFDMFLGQESGSIGEVSVLLLVLGGVYLLLRRVIDWRIPVSFIGTVAFLSFMFPQIAQANRIDYMLWQICGGGLMLGAIFMATDYTTSPVTKTGRVIYGIGCGLITVFIRFFGTYPEGVSFSILIMNTLVWYLDRYTKPVRFGGLKHGKTK